MIQNKNEEYLLKYLSGALQEEKKENDLISFLAENNISIQFKNVNPVYQIIDELNFSNILELRKK